MRTDGAHSKLRSARPQAIEQQRRVLRELARPDPLRRRHAGERVGDQRRHAGPLGDELVEPGQQRAAAGQDDLVDLVVRRRREEELQRAGDFERQRLHERLQHVGVVVLGQALVLLGGFGLFRREVERALDVVRQLVAAERLVAGEQELVVAQHVEVRDVRADVDAARCSGRGRWPAATARSARTPPASRRTRRPSPAACRPAASAMATRSSTFSLREAAIRTSTSSGLLGAGPRIWKSRLTSSSANGMYWLASASTVQLELLLLLAGRDDDLLGDHHRRRQGHGDVPVAACPAASSPRCSASLTWSRLAMLPSVTASLGSGSMA